MKYVLAILILFSSISIKADTDKAAISTVIEHFVKGADEHNTEFLASALHPQAQQFFIQKGELKTLTTDLYLKLIEAKKIGGKPRQLKIVDIDVSDYIATAKIEIRSGKVLFHDHVSLMKIDGHWKIMNIVLRYEAG